MARTPDIRCSYLSLTESGYVRRWTGFEFGRLLGSITGVYAKIANSKSGSVRHSLELSYYALINLHLFFLDYIPRFTKAVSKCLK